MVYWSLSLDEQFYLIYPFAIYFLSKKHITAIAFIAIALQFFVFRDSGSLAWTTRTDAILAGILIGMYGDKLNKINIKDFSKNKLIGYFVFSILVFALLMIPATKYGKMVGFTTLLCAALVFIATHRNLKIIPDGFTKDILIYIGSRSYAIYLVHMPVFILTFEIYSKASGSVASLGSGVVLTILSFTCVIILAEINYRFVEIPFISKGKTLAQRYKNKIDNNLRKSMTI